MEESIFGRGIQLVLEVIESELGERTNPVPDRVMDVNLCIPRISTS